MSGDSALARGGSRPGAVQADGMSSQPERRLALVPLHRWSGSTSRLAEVP